MHARESDEVDADVVEVDVIAGANETGVCDGEVVGLVDEWETVEDEKEAVGLGEWAVDVLELRGGVEVGVGVEGLEVGMGEEL